MKTSYLLTVIGGTGSIYTNAGTTVTISSTHNPAVEEFVQWADDPFGAITNASFIATDSTTDVCLPWRDVTLTAVTTPHPYLTVTNGLGDNGSGFYVRGTVATVTVDTVAHMSFEKWLVDPPAATNDFGGDFVETDATTYLIVSNDVALTATYTNTLYTLTVTNGSGAGLYTNGQEVAISAFTPPAALEFDCWDGDYIPVADRTNPVTTVTIPGSSIALIATYRDKRYQLTVEHGSGSGFYTNTQVVAISAAAPPTAGHTFDHWEGDTTAVADTTAASTSFTMPNTNTTLTAVYRSVAEPQKTFMVVPLAGGPADYLDAPPPGGWTDDYKTTHLVLRKIQAGGFKMGSPASETGRGSSETQHSVTLTKDFYLGLFEVTQEQWQQIEGSNPSYFSGAMLPVEQVSYETIRNSFMNTLRARVSGIAFNLPTEAQWEYACRAGTTGAYAGDIGSMAWYLGNSGSATHAVGTKAPNAWGLYDMHGNVSEFCLDWWSNDLGSAAQTDPTGPATALPGTYNGHVRRGGEFSSADIGIRSAYRNLLPVTNMVTGAGLVSNAVSQTGFRVAVSLTSASFLLTVEGGSVNTGGVFAAGTDIGLTPAPAPDGQKFAVWQVAPANADLGAGFTAADAQTLLKMPASDVTVTAVYIPTNATGVFRCLLNGTEELWKVDGETFTVTAPAPATGKRFASWTVDPTAANLGAGFDAGSATTTVVMPAHDVTLTAAYASTTPVIPDGSGPTAGVAFSFDASAGLPSATFAAKGLPAGLKLDKNSGMISGIPTKAGTYTVTITATLPDRSKFVYTVSISVAALSTTAQGTFTGWLSRTGGDALDGLFTLTVAKTGKLTAKLALQTATVSLSAKAWTSTAGGVFTAVFANTRTGEQMTLSLNSATGVVTGSASGGKFGAGALDIDAFRNAALNAKDDAAQAALARYKGYYTVALPMASHAVGPLGNVQSGSGYLTLTVGTRASVKIAGKLADGTAVSGAATLVIDGTDAYVPLFKALYTKRGVFSGLLKLEGGTTPSAQRIADDPAFALTWLYPGKSKALTDDRFDARLSAYGAYYDTLANIQTAYAGYHFEAGGFGWTLPLIPGSAGALAFPKKGPDNPDGAILKAAKKTGIFSGSFKTVDGTTGRTVTLKHLGVLTRDGGAYLGEGAYVQPRKVGGYTLKASYPVFINP